MSGHFSLKRWGLLACIVGISSLAWGDEKEYTLVYKFQPGQFYYIEGEDLGEMIIQDAKAVNKDGNPFESKSHQHTQMLKSFRVVTTDENGGAVLEPILEKVRMASQVDDKPIVSFDSTTGEQPPKEFEKISGTLGRPLARFHVTASGRLVKVSMLVNDAPATFTEAAAKADPLINILTVMPENAANGGEKGSARPVKIGDKWSEKFEMTVSVGSNLTQKLSQKISLIKSFELTKVEENIATITVRTNLLTPSEDPEILRQIAQMVSAGTIEFDMQQGRVMSKFIKIDEKVINAFGAQTLLHARGQSMEKALLQNPASRVATGAPDAPKTLPK